MNFYPIWPYFISMALLLAVIKTRLFNATETPSGRPKNRQGSIDGLRGFLAFGVFFGHAALYHEFMLHGNWYSVEMPEFYAILPGIGVALFFMITGYLFFGKLIRAAGRPNWVELYIGRAFRIGPLYLVAVAIMLLIVAVRSDFKLLEPFSDVMAETVRWLPIGIDKTRPDVNGYFDTSLLLAGVTWTLAYEWQFYAGLLVLSFAARTRLIAVMFTATALFVGLLYTFVKPNANHDPTHAVCACLFFAGMLTAALEANGLLAKANRHLLSALAIGSLAVLWVISTTAYAAVPAALLALFFYLVVSGADLFGLLSSAAARRMGNISYGIYLLQGLVLTLVFSQAGVSSFALTSPLQHWLVGLVCAAILMVFAAVMHVWVELPGILAGRRVAALLQKRQISAA